MPHSNPSDDALRQLLAATRTIAMVGASAKPDRPSHDVMQILLDAGFHVIPVTPHEAEVLGQRAYPTLDAVPEPIDIVDVFRRAEETPAIADAAVAIGAKALWLQLGISNEDAAERARTGGLTVVMNRCIGQTVQRLGITRLDVEVVRDVVDEAGRESFPASDPPMWSHVRVGAPRHSEPDRSG